MTLGEFQCVDRHGKVKKLWRSLTTVRKYVAAHRITRVELRSLPDEGAEFTLYAACGDRVRGRYASMVVLKAVLRRWWRIVGAKLYIDGVRHGVVATSNPSLPPGPKLKVKR